MALQESDSTPVTSRLLHLRTQLTALRRARGRVRMAAAWAAVAIAVLLALGVVFALDLVFALAVPQRVVALLLAAVGVGWAYWRFTRPLLTVRENEIDAALSVQRQLGLGSDVVAALQFEQLDAASWGSPQLAGRVVEIVAHASPRINVFAGFARGQLLRRLLLLAGCMLAAVLIGALWPGHLAAFAGRLLLGSGHYPTRTRIEQILINRSPVLTADAANRAPADAKSAQGRPVSFVIQCQGALPQRGIVFVTAADASDQRTRVELKPLSLDERLARLTSAGRMLTESVQTAAGPISAPWRDEVAALLQFDAPAAAQLLGVARTHADLPPIARRIKVAAAELPTVHGQTAVLAGELGRLNDDVSYRIAAGDARTDAAKLRMIPLPAIEVRLDPKPPKYTRGHEAAKPSSGGQIAVLEGSSIDVQIVCVNGKPLKAAWLTLQTGQSNSRIELQASGAKRDVWTVPPGIAALRGIRAETRYEVQVVDADGLSLETPIRGAIRIRHDLLPTTTASVVHRVVLPTAAPVVTFRASDDFGLASLALVAEVERQSTRTPAAPANAADAADEASAAADSPAAAIPTEIHRTNIPFSDVLLTGDRLSVASQYALTLGPLKLAKGDRVKLTLEATDYRGENEQGAPAGLTQASEPLLLEISDESGVLAAIAEADPRTEEQLNEIIKRQLNIGDGARP